MIKKASFAAAVFALAACASTDSVGVAPACEVSAADSAWIERALEAWRFTSREITEIQGVRNFQAVFFDDDCVLTSPNALTSASHEGVTWTLTPHAGTIPLPDGDEMPASVTSFTRADQHLAYFVMSTPSVWRAGGVDNPVLGLETMMVAVLLHEGSHVVQSATYGRRVEQLALRYNLPESFNDDSLQEQFGEDAAFAASIARETDLFFQAAAAPDDASARRLALEARDMMRARARQFYVGENVYWTEGEDLWLTFEGAGQWAGYQWVINPHGANVSPEVATPNFGRRSRWWSQNEGLAIFLVLDRLGSPDWKGHAFGDGAQTALEMLDGGLL